MNNRPIIKIDESKCDGCGQCARACEEGAIQIVNGKAKLVSETYCDGLGACIGECPRDAIAIEERPAQAFHRERGSQSHAANPDPAVPPASELAQWPVQLRLVPANAPFLAGARLLIAADCVPFAFAAFHRRFLRGRILLIGCPKFDDADLYRAKLADIFRANDIRSVEVAFMEVPCCFGLLRLVQAALDDSGKNIPLSAVKIGLRGNILHS
jgi:Pyruvate/2-oxoacid:ferredoxin oxidoreductase delta subunit